MTIHEYRWILDHCFIIIIHVPFTYSWGWCLVQQQCLDEGCSGCEEGWEREAAGARRYQPVVIEEFLFLCCLHCYCCLPHWHHPRPLWMRSQIVRERMRRRTEGGAGFSEVRGTPRHPPDDIFHGSTALLKSRFDNCHSSNTLRYLYFRGSYTHWLRGQIWGKVHL